MIHSTTANVSSINRSQITAACNSASARQIAAGYEYQQTVLKAYIEVVNQLAQIRNLNQSFDLKTQQVGWHWRSARYGFFYDLHGRRYEDPAIGRLLG